MKRFLLLLFVLFSLLLASAAVRAEASLSFCVNEICSDNGGNYLIANAAADYVELRNLTDQAISLDGFFISDDQDHLNKFSLNGYELPENGYLILAADKKELPFKLSGSEGEELFISDGENHILQQVHLPPLEKDTTYSLQESGEWHITEPTPMAENAEGTPYVKKVYVASPRFSHEAGFYDAPFDLAIDCYKTYRVYYTTDGAVPDEHATLYTAPIHIEDATSNPNTLSMRTDITVDDATPPAEKVKKATVIRAVAIDEDGNRSSVETKTYFVGFQRYKAYQNIPILSIVAEPDDLFDEQDGIHVRGRVYQEWLAKNAGTTELAKRDIPTNYRQRGREWEIPVSIQEFDENGSMLFSQNAGLRIHGSSTRERTQKSFNLYARKDYGDKEFQFDLVPGKEKREKYVVRINAGIDSIIHEMLKDLGLPTSGTQPCLCFLNGEFWGFYELREKQDEEYIADCYGLNQKDLIVVKNSHLKVGTELAEALGYNVEARGITKGLDRLFSELDTSTPEGYKAAEEVIDIDNYLTYIVGNLFFNNGDFLNNDTFWRTGAVNDEPYHDGRWRWIYQDMDQGFSSVKYKDTLAMVMDKGIFISLWNNESFRTKFYTLTMDFANVLFTAESVRDFVTERLNYYDGYYQITNERFTKANTGDSDNAKYLRETILNFLKRRRDELISQFAESLSDKRETRALAVKELPSEARLLVNGHAAFLKNGAWEGVYFTGCEVILETGAIPGYKFSGWYENGTLLTEQASVTVSTDANHTLTPAYDPIPDIAVMDRINYARSNYRNGYVLYKRNQKSNCVIEPDAALDSYVDFTSINISSEGKWEKGTGFTVTFPTDELSSCGMILYCTVPEGCPKQWALYYEEDSGAKTKMDVTIEETKDGTCFSFDLPPAYMGLPEVILHLESAEDCPGGTIQITKIRLYGDAAEET